MRGRSTRTRSRARHLAARRRRTTRCSSASRGGPSPRRSSRSRGRSPANRTPRALDLARSRADSKNPIRIQQLRHELGDPTKDSKAAFRMTTGSPGTRSPTRVAEHDCTRYDRGDLERTCSVFALLSDIHANIEALDACLKHARQGGATRYAFLGDLVGYGADPQRVVETVMRYQSGGALVVQGNHDVAVETTEGGMSDGAAETRDWTRGVLDAAAKDWLRSLPLCLREDQLCFVHASAAAPGRWEYV